jgi:ATP-dependent DNA helicase DinG
MPVKNLETGSSDLLGDKGVFSRRAQDFTPRAGQQKMAEAVQAALNSDSGKPLLIEAGTGIGKTFGYLVPVLQSGKRTLLATATKHLQDQLYRIDIPEVSAVMDRRPVVALLKGRSNYYCPYYAEYHYNNALMGKRVNKDTILAVIEWARQSPDGDMDGLPIEDAVRSFVTSQQDTCLGRQCPKADRCPLLRARTRAARADITVINHHLLLANDVIAEDGGVDLFAGAEVVIVDECHQLVETANQFYGSKLNSRHWQRLLAEVVTTVRSKYNDMAFVIEAAGQADRYIQLLHSGLADNSKCLWVQQMALQPHLLDIAASLCRALDAVGKTLELVALRCATLQQFSLRAKSLLAAMLELREPLLAGKQAVADKLVYCEINKNGFVMRLLSASIDDRVNQLLARGGRSWVFTSSTVSFGQQDNSLIKRLGLDDADFLQIESPFDYRNQALLYLPANMPDPAQEDYPDLVARAMLPVLQASQGRALCLFTSRHGMESACRLFREQLDYPLFMQGTASKQQLIGSFIQSGNGILAGMRSFWEGVDIPGSALCCVIIDKLPFLHPDDPTVRAHSAAINYAGGQAFNDYQLPVATARLCQGVGRLIRKITDSGIVMITDPRLSTQHYGESFLTNLPDMPLTREFSEAQQFLQSIEVAAQ